MRVTFILAALAFSLASCDQATERPVLDQSPPAHEGTPIPSVDDPWVEPTPIPEDLVLPTPTPAALVEETLALPPKPLLSDAGRRMITESEGFDRTPAWPAGSSGVTIGYGYDLGYSARDVIEQDWRKLQDDWRHRLAAKSGLTGSKAKAAIPSVRDIQINKQIGTEVFDEVDMARWFVATKRVLPGFEQLRPHAQEALVSLGYNRGWSMIGDRRVECRAIRDVGVPKQDYAYIAGQLRKMKRIWVGTDIERGMNNRREAEARLVEMP